MLAGQLIFRETTMKPPDAGRKLIMVRGIVAVPNDWQGKGEHQYVVTGCVDGVTNIHIHFDTEIDLTEHIEGLTLDGLIKSPLWRAK